MKKSILFLTFIMLLTASCKNDKKNETSTEPDVKKEAIEETATNEENEVSLELSGDDLMKFDKSELKVKAGQKITLTLKHTGKMSKDIMGHNFVLLKQGTIIADFATKAITGKDNNYIPEGDEVIAYTKIISGGESVTITFDAPTVGTYDFICSFPGHYGMMKGKFIVE